jgi:phosphoribosylformylglycinamidine cyclo-ligase
MLGVSIMSDAYKRAGVDIHAGYEAVNLIKKHTVRTMRSEVLSSIGGFGGLFQLDLSRYKNPVLVSGTDGVGTKLKIAFSLDKHDTIGIDCVAMCVNDIAVLGAEPLFFLDYIGCGKLEPGIIEEVVKGVAEGCVQAGCSLIGGETAEMPGMYENGEYDIAGFAVGVVEKDRILDGKGIKPGDLVLGLASSGLHSNGFSLVRKLLLEEKGMKLDSYVEALGKTLGEELLTPTRIYVSSLLKVRDLSILKGVSHITGGGFIENIPRVLPEGCAVEIDYGSWQVPPIFHLLKEAGNLKGIEMFNTFNMGIGLVMIVSNENSDEVRSLISLLEESGEKVYLIGRVTAGDKEVTFGGVPLE